MFNSTSGLSKGTGTKTTVLMHVGVGDHVAETCDQSVDTLWRGSITPMSTKSTMPDLTYRLVSIILVTIS